MWPLLLPFRSFALAWLTQNYSLIFSGTKDAEFILQASTKKTTLTSQTSKKTSPPLLSFLLLWSLEGLSDCKVKGERKGQSDLFSLIFPQIPAKNGKWGQNPAISHYYEGDFILMKAANGQNILTVLNFKTTLSLINCSPSGRVEWWEISVVSALIKFLATSHWTKFKSWSLEIYFSSLNKGFFPRQWGFECNLLS